ncbi:MAG: hypothetical protein H6907_02700 [Hyphomicrobiales bacterium]|nr:hypothetical protein [Hyphomicrobiales bacterium]
MPDEAAAAALPDPAEAGRLHPGNVIPTLLLLCCGALTAAGKLGGWHAAITGATVLAGLFMVLELVRVPRQPLITAAVFIAVGSAIAYYTGDLMPVLVRASEGTLVFIVLFVSVAFLRYPALHSPSMHAAREVIISQPPGRRYTTLSIAAHLFGALTNIAALSLLTTFLHSGLSTLARERMACAMTRGFAVGAIWSPFFVSIAVILYVMPDMTWLKIAGGGVPLAVLLLAYGTIFDRFMNRPRRDAPPPGTAPQPLALEGRVVGRIAVLALVLVGSILTLSESLALSTPVAIFLVTPLISIAWQALLVRAGASGSLPMMARRVVEGICGLRMEIAVFFSANFLGYAAGRAIDPDALAAALQSVHIVGPLAIFLLLATMLSLTMLMLHPLVLVVLAGQVFPTEALGVHDTSLALCMALVWGVGVTCSPASGLTLFMLRVLDRSPFYLAWRLNALYAVGGFVLGGLYISVVNTWFL